MKLQREDIHPLQDTCPYFSSVYSVYSVVQPIPIKLLLYYSAGNQRMSSRTTMSCPARFG
jgi:hypothetical protein